MMRPPKTGWHSCCEKKALNNLCYTDPAPKTAGFFIAVFIPEKLGREQFLVHERDQSQDKSLLVNRAAA